MISMLCQKSNEGVIQAENSELFNFVFQGEQKIEPHKNTSGEESRFTKYNTDLDSNFLKKFPTLYKVGQKTRFCCFCFIDYSKVHDKCLGINFYPVVNLKNGGSLNPRV